MGSFFQLFVIYLHWHIPQLKLKSDPSARLYILWLASGVFTSYICYEILELNNVKLTNMPKYWIDFCSRIGLLKIITPAYQFWGDVEV